MIDYAKKGYKIAVVALVFAIMGWMLPGSSTTESIFEIEVNNTNLAPNSTDSVGTGERIQGTTYYANETTIDIYVWAHAQSPGDTAEVHLFVNGTKLQDQSDKVIGAAEQLNNSVTGRIPRYASYKIEVNNFHHYEWREYRVISGQNGSVNLTTNYYNITGGSVDNTTLNLKINKTGDIVGDSFRLNNSIVNGFMYIKSALISWMATNPNGDYSLIEISNDTILLNVYNNTNFTNRNYYFDDDGLNMGGRNITNCDNCSEFSKLIKTSTYTTGEITSGSTTIPHDDTIPQITEGNFFGNVTITPASASSKIKVCSQIMLSTSQASPNLLQIMIFINGSNNASAISSTYSPAAFYEVNTGVCYTTQVPTTNSFNVTARYGSNAAGTITVNGANLGRQYGGSYNSYIIVDEYKD